MRTADRMRHLVWGVLGLVSEQVFSQTTQPNNLGGAGSFLGWNAGANQILDVRNDGNRSIDFYTNANYKMRLYPNVVGNIPNALGGTNAVNQDGFVAISPEPAFYGAGNYGPFTRLHLADLGDGVRSPCKQRLRLPRLEANKAIGPG